MFYKRFTTRSRDASAPEKGRGSGIGATCLSRPRRRRISGGSKLQKFIRGPAPSVASVREARGARHVPCRAFGLPALEVLEKSVRRIHQVTRRASLLEDGFDLGVPGEDKPINRERKAAALERVQHVFGDDGHDITFEAEKCLRLLDEEMNLRPGALSNHSTWLLQRLESAHDEVDELVSKCRGQARAVARALSGPRFCAADVERYGQPMQVLDDVDGQGPEAQCSGRRQKKASTLKEAVRFLKAEGWYCTGAATARCGPGDCGRREGCSGLHGEKSTALDHGRALGPGL